MKSRSVLLQRIDPIQNQHVQVDVQIECTAETLDQGDNTGSGAAAGSEPRPVGQIGLDGPDDDCEAAPKRVRPAGEEQAQRPGEACDRARRLERYRLAQFDRTSDSLLCFNCAWPDAEKEEC